MPGVSLNANDALGQTGSLPSLTNSGVGEIYGIFISTGFPSIGLIPHIPSGVKPSVSANVYYPQVPPFETGAVALYFFIMGITGLPSWLAPGGYADLTHPLLSGTGNTSLNCEVLTNGQVKYAGTSGYLRPSGYLLHKEVYALLPNYALPDIGITGATGVNYPTSVGGVYPAMLQDNILSINVEMTWWADSGDAINC